MPVFSAGRAAGAKGATETLSADYVHRLLYKGCLQRWRNRKSYTSLTLIFSCYRLSAGWRRERLSGVSSDFIGKYSMRAEEFVKAVIGRNSQHIAMTLRTTTVRTVG